MSDHGLSVGDVVETHRGDRMEVAGVDDEDEILTLTPEGDRSPDFETLQRWDATSMAEQIENGEVRVVEGVRDTDDGDEWRGTDDLPGRPQAREAGARLTIKTREAQHGYVAEFERGADLVGEMLNISGSAASLSPGGTLEFGGDRRKRVTVLDQGPDGHLLAVEIGDRD